MIKNNKNKTVVVAMSGGVDSSVAAALLKDERYNLIGITMKTWGFDDFPEKDSGCCSLETIYSARNVSQSLGFNHYTLDFTEKFNEIVINNFLEEYLRGNTPNPCVLCNKSIKWGALLEKAESLGADFIATGHYAKVNFNEKSGRYFVSAAEDNQKDQSYALWRVSQYALSKTIFPLGKYTKKEIRNIAKDMGLKSSDTPDSQEICFVPNDNYRELIQIRNPGLNEKLSGGDLVYKEQKIGTHKGYPYYTIGQRRGLNVAVGKRLYVSKIDSEKNVVFVDEEHSLYNSEFTLKEINLMKVEKISKPSKVNVKIRYNDSGHEAVIEQLSDDSIKVTFDSPQKAITPGQSAVFYIGEDIVGGGIIKFDHKMKMDLYTNLEKNSRQNIKTIIFPESYDNRVIDAVKELLNKKTAKVILIRTDENTDPVIQADKNLTILSINSHNDFIEEYHSIKSEKKPEYKLSQSKKDLKDPLTFSCMLLKNNFADGIIAGSVYSTSEVIRKAISIIGLSENNKTVSSFFLFTFPENHVHNKKILAYADCGVLPNPDSQQLSDIAVMTADNFQKLTGLIPKVAFLSFSTKGSASDDSLKKITEAFEITKKRIPEMLCDGELQFDAAFIPEIAKRKDPSGRIKGEANVFIFPDLNSGNIAYKITERVGGATATGPIIQGLAKPVMDLSRGCNVNDIVNMSKIITNL